MKRSIVAVLLIMAVCLSLAGCGGSSAKELDIATFASSAIEKVEFGDELLAVPDNMLSDYYVLPKDKVSASAVYVSGTGATASELAVFKCKDADAAKAVKTAVETRISEQIASYENYRPDEKFRLENAFVAVEGNYVVFAVSNDNQAVEKLLESSMK